MNQDAILKFKEKLSGGQMVFGPFMKTCDPAFVEVAGWAGMDFAILDMEHGPVGVESMQNNIRAAQISNVLPIVRVSSNTEEAIGKALDIGAAGVEIPQIKTAEEARDAVRFSKFYPQGKRGVCRFVRAAEYSLLERNEYFKTANDTIVILHVEGVEALANMDSIFDVDGIDIVFIGPYDLSQSLGVPGQTMHPTVIAAMKEVVARAKEKGVVIGTFTDTRETMEMWIRAGVQYISYSVDVGIFAESCCALVRNFNEICEESNA